MIRVSIKQLVLIAVILSMSVSTGLLFSQENNSLTYKESMWAKMNSENRLVTVANPVFQRGETIYLVLRDVGPFQLGSDGKHFMDIDMTVFDPSGTVVLEQKNLLGENGHQLLEDNHASSPHGIFTSAVNYDPGEYTMHLKVRDVVANTEVMVIKKFKLSDQLGFRKAVFARQDENKEFVPVEDATFQRGENVHLLLLNVGKFLKGSDGKHNLEIDLEVTAPDGKVVYAKDHMLNGSGHTVLADDIASSPYASFQSTIQLDAGSYRMKITVHDLNAQKYLNVVRSFILK